MDTSFVLSLSRQPRDVRRSFGVTRRDVKRAERCARINDMARQIAARAESEPVEESIFELMEAEGAGYADSLAAWN